MPPANFILVPRTLTKEMELAASGAVNRYLASLTTEEKDLFFPRMPGCSWRIPEHVKLRIRWEALLAAAPKPAESNTPNLQEEPRDDLET
jgi:hypothetical protein